MSLIVAALCSPLVAADPQAPDVLHAATMEAVVGGWEAGEVMSACGVEGLKLVGSEHGNEILFVEWPPRVSSLVAPMVRCGECHVATGRKRPRSAFRPTVAS